MPAGDGLFTPQQITWLERYMRLISGRQVQQQSSQIVSLAQPVGFWLIVPDDLTAYTNEYVYTHPVTGLTFLYCNGASVSQTTYSTLYSLWGTNKYGADSGGDFVLPDARGRSLWLAGTNGAVDVGDNDGVSEALRQPKHTHAVASHTHGSSGLSVTGSPSITDPGHTHNIVRYDTPDSSPGAPGQTVTTSGSLQSPAATSSATTGISAGAGSLDVAGSTDAAAPTSGSGMDGGDAVAHLVLGSLVVRF